MTVGEATVKLIEAPIVKTAYYTTWGWYGDNDVYHPEERYTEWTIVVEAEGIITIGPYNFRRNSKKIHTGIAVSTIEQYIGAYSRKDAQKQAEFYSDYSGIKKWKWEQKENEETYYTAHAKRMAENKALETALLLDKRGFKVTLDFLTLDQETVEKLSCIGRRKITKVTELTDWAVDRYSRKSSAASDLKSMRANDEQVLVAKQ